MVQGINQEYIFDTQKNREKYLKLIYSNNINVQIIAYCIMDNHAHMLVETDEIQDIEAWMKKSNTSYAIYYNRSNDRVGYVFRDRYKAQPIKNQKHLYSCIEYIHNNPVKAGMCKNKREYQFSSYSAIYQADQTELQKKVQKILSQCMLQREEIQENFELIEDERENKEEKCERIINYFLKDNKIDKEQLKKEGKYLKKIVKILKYENNISYRVMEKNLKISREKLRKLMII